MKGHKQAECPLNEKIEHTRQAIKCKGLVSLAKAERNAEDLQADAEHFNNQRAIYGLCRINGRETYFLTDTGCSRTILSDKILTQEERNDIQKAEFHVITCNDLPVHILGTLRVKIIHATYVTWMDTLIESDLEEECLMGYDFLKNSPTTKQAIERLRKAVQAPMRTEGAYKYFKSDQSRSRQRFR